jgi:hypothetical protein
MSPALFPWSCSVCWPQGRTSNRRFYHPSYPRAVDGRLSRSIEISWRARLWVDLLSSKSKSKPKTRLSGSDAGTSIAAKLLQSWSIAAGSLTSRNRLARNGSMQPTLLYSSIWSLWPSTVSTTTWSGLLRWIRLASRMEPRINSFPV